MKICRFISDAFEGPRFGIVEGSEVLPLPAGISISEAAVEAPARGPRGRPARRRASARAVAPRRSSASGATTASTPELGNPMPVEPLLFMKAPPPIVASGDFIELPTLPAVEHEGELASLSDGGAPPLRPTTRRIRPRLRLPQRRYRPRPPARRRAVHTRQVFDTFCPVGPESPRVSTRSTSRSRRASTARRARAAAPARWLSPSRTS